VCSHPEHDAIAKALLTQVATAAPVWSRARPSGSGPLGTVSHNIFNGNISNGPFVVGYSGATIQQNVANGNGTSGIGLGTVQSPTEVTNNTSLANGMVDLFDGQTPNCKGTVWSGNTFFTANQSCIH